MSTYKILNVLGSSKNTIFPTFSDGNNGLLGQEKYMDSNNNPCTLGYLATLKPSLMSNILYTKSWMLWDDPQNSVFLTFSDVNNGGAWAKKWHGLQ